LASKSLDPGVIGLEVVEITLMKRKSEKQ